MSWYLQLTIKWPDNKLEKIDGARTRNYDETSKIFYISNRSTNSSSWGKVYATYVYLQKIFYPQKAYTLKKSVCSSELSSFPFD